MTLSRLPAGQVRGEVPSVAASVWAFPVVGVVIGGLAAALYAVTTALGVPPTLAAFLVVGLSVVLTGALHEDGLADMADGFGGGHTKDRKLEIMRDSRIGSYGAVALILAIALRASALPMVAAPVLALIGLAAFSRALMPFVMWLLPPARSDGLGKSAGEVSGGLCLIALGLGALAMLPLGLPALWVILGMVVAALGVARLAKVQIGGQTGDVLGATQQITEISGWLILAAIY